MTTSGTWRLERVAHPSTMQQFLVTAAGLILALIIGGVLILVAGENPWDVYRAIWDGAFGSSYRRSEVFVKMIPLLLTGLGVAVAFRMKLWNIGAEGQLYAGAICTTWIALYVLPEAESWLVIPVMVVAGMAGGALWAGIAGGLRAYLGVNETITTLMLNYVAIRYSEYLVHGPWKNPMGFGFPGTETFGTNTWLWTWGNTRVHAGLFFGLAAAALLFLVLRNTRWGYEIRITGENERAARYAGMATSRNLLVVLMVSGALAGLAGMAEVAGIGHSLQRELSPGYGYTAIIVAWLGRLHPIGVVIVAYGIAALTVGGDNLQISLGLSGAISVMLQGTLLFCLLAGDTLQRYRLVRIREVVPA